MKKLWQAYLNSSWASLLIFVVLEGLDSELTHAVLGNIRNPAAMTKAQGLSLYASNLLSIVTLLSFAGIIISLGVRISKKQWQSVVLTLFFGGALGIGLIYLINLDLKSAGI